MKQIFICSIAGILLMFAGCAGPGIINQSDVNLLKQTSQALEPYVEVLAKDWPKASGIIRGGLDEGYLPQYIINKMNEIDSWWKDSKGNWIPSDEMTLNEYQKWYIAGARLGHTGSVLQAIIRQYAPGLLNFSQVVSGLAFLGLGGL